MNDDALHDWLYGATKDGPEPLDTLADDIRVSRLNKIPLEGLPTTAVDLLSALKRLHIGGRATVEKVNGVEVWKWCEIRKEPVAAQGALFV